MQGKYPFLWMEDKAIQRQTPPLAFWHISLASSCSGKVNIGLTCRHVFVAHTPPQSSGGTQELYYLIMISCWDEWLLVQCVCG